MPSLTASSGSGAGGTYTAGTDTIADTASTQVVTHELGATPDTVLLTPRSGELMWVSSRNTTTFTAERAGTSGALDFDWLATGAASVGPPPDLLPVDTGLVLHLDATAISGLAEGDPVTEWPDQSSTSTNVTQATVSAQPTFRAVSINGLAGVDFDGADWLEYASARLTNAADGTMTAFAVIKPDSTSGVRMIVSNDQGSGARGPQAIRQNGSAIEITSSGSVANDGAGVAMSPGTTYIAETIQTTTAVQAYVNGTGNGSTSTGTTPTSTSQILRIGSYNGSFNFDGVMAEIVVYNRALSDTERGEVRTYLATKWGV